MDQREFPLLQRLEGAAIVPAPLLRQCRSYRQAVRLCWALRRTKLNASDAARIAGLTRQHVSDYLNDDDKPSRRDLPAEKIGDFEELCGNTAITQWLAERARLTVMEVFQAAMREGRCQAA